MQIDERERHALHSRLVDVLGEHEASTLMDHLPPVGWADVATKRDLDHLATTLRGDIEREIGDLRTELHQEIGGLRTELHQEIGGLRSELHREIGGLRTGLHREIGGLRSELHQEAGRIYHAMSRQTRSLMIALVTSNATLAGMAFAAARLV